jgi:hypothetical protein
MATPALFIPIRRLPVRTILSLAAAAVLAGCSTFDAARDAWAWDTGRTQERKRIVLSPEELAALTNRTADLQLQLTSVRSRISAEPSVQARLGLYEELHRVGRELSPLQRQLTAAAPAR